MNKTFSLLWITLAFALSLKAEAQQLPLFPELDYREHMEKLLESCENVGNGDCYRSTYNTATFDSTKELHALKAHLYDADRDYQYEAETDWKYILSNDFVVDSGISESLQYFLDHKLVRALYGFYPNEEQCTESEYCSIYVVHIYLTSGEKISFTLDHTD